MNLSDDAAELIAETLGEDASRILVWLAANGGAISDGAVCGRALGIPATRFNAAIDKLRAEGLVEPLLQ